MIHIIVLPPVVAGTPRQQVVPLLETAFRRGASMLAEAVDNSVGVL
jgi:hypothetical protein